MATVPSNPTRARARRGGRLEPKGGWRLGVKTAAPPPGAGAPDPEETPAERQARERADALRARRLSHELARRDAIDLGLDADHTRPGMPLVRRFRGGTEPRTAHHGDPVEDSRTARRPSTSVWAQDPRPEHLREEAREDEPRLRREFEGRAAVAELSGAVVGGMGRLVAVRWTVLTDRSIASAEETAYQASKPRLADDGGVPSPASLSAISAEHREVVPPLPVSLAEVDCDPALLHLAGGEYPGAEHEPPLPSLPRDEHSRLVQGGALDVIERAQSLLESRHARRCLTDPEGSLEAERAWADGRAGLRARAAADAPRPEESRVLLAAMDEYAERTGRGWAEARFTGHVFRAVGRDPVGDRLPAETLELARGQFPDLHAAVSVAQVPPGQIAGEGGGVDAGRARAIARLHAATGRDPVASPLGEDVVERALAAGPRLTGQLRAVDPDSPLVAAPAGLDVGRHERIVAGALDRALLVPPASRGPASVADLELDVAEAAAQALGPDAPARGEPGPRRVPRPPVRAPGDIDSRFNGFLDACAHLGAPVAVAGGPRAEAAAVLLSPQHFDSREVHEDGVSRLRVSVRPGVEPFDAVPRAAAAVGCELVGRAGDAGDDGGRAAGVFGVRVAARVLDHPLDDGLLGDRSPAVLAGTRLAGEVAAAARDLGDHERERLRQLDRADRRTEAAERLDGVVGAFRTRGVEVDAPAPDACGRPSFSRGADGSAAVRLGHGALAHAHGQAAREIPDHDLARLHAEAYVALGRASGALAGPHTERAPDYEAAYPPGGPPVGADLPAAPGGAALREQIVADGFAAAQMEEAWGGERLPLRGVRKAEGRTLELEGGWPEAAREQAASYGQALRASVNRATSQVAITLGRPAPEPAAPPQPAPAASAAGAPGRERPAGPAR